MVAGALVRVLLVIGADKGAAGTRNSLSVRTQARALGGVGLDPILVLLVGHGGGAGAGVAGGHVGGG
jgi:hypothetical protein